MKVFSCPADVKFERADFENFDLDKEEARIEEHKAALKAYLREKGFTGKHTGEVVSFQVADGSALYMLAEGPKSCLIHLPYWDAYQYPYIHRLTKKEILDQISYNEKIASLFKK